MATLLDVANLEPGQQSAEPPIPQVQGVPTAQRVRLIHSIQTDLMIQSFNDRILVILTQLGRIGCMIQVSPPPSTLPAALPSHSSSSDSSALSSLPPPHPSSTLSPLFGVPPSPHVSALHDLYASQIAAILFEKMTRETQGMEVKPVVLGIGLKRSQDLEKEDEEESGISEDERETFSQVMEMLKECIR
ncbi:hypothetical protein JCM5353_008263 [Sporobolomyces roseus]